MVIYCVHFIRAVEHPCGQESKVNPEKKPNSDALELQEQLRIRLQKASDHYQDYSQRFDKVLEERNAGLFEAPDGSGAVRQARIQESAARDEYMSVLRMFTDLVLKRKGPDEPSPGHHVKFSDSYASSDHPEQLTPRENEVLALIADGCSSKEIAARLEITVKTAVTHRQHIMDKLGAHNSATLIRVAIHRGLIEP
jgi:DNA-binding CsgD family transcriptional regulator